MSFFAIHQHLLVCGVALLSSYDQQKLLESVAIGDEAAFAHLVLTYGKQVFAFVQLHCRNRELSEEIVQDVFTQVWLTREGLTSIRNFEGFLYILSRNYTFDALRKLMRAAQKQHEYNRQLAYLPQESGNSNDDDGWKVDLINTAVAKLPPQQRKVWQLARIEGFKRSEVAEQMNISQETVKKYLQYATASIINYVESSAS